MKKITLRITALILLAAIILSLPLTGLAKKQWIGEVIASQITLRDKPKTNGKSLGKLKNGTQFTILDESKGWFHIEHEGKQGYVGAAYVVENPDHMTLLSYTNVYAYPHSDKCVGQLSAYTRLTVIDEVNGYYVVSLRDASGFIKRSADFVLDSEIINSPILGHIVMNDTVPSRSGPSSSYAKGPYLEKDKSYPYIAFKDDWYTVVIDNSICYMWNGQCREEKK